MTAYVEKKKQRRDMTAFYLKSSLSSSFLKLDWREEKERRQESARSFLFVKKETGSMFY